MSGRAVTRLVTSAAVAVGLVMGAAAVSPANQVSGAVTVDRPNPKERPTPGSPRPDPRCDRAEQGLAIAKANVMKAKQRLRAAPKSKKTARKAQLKAAKQSRSVAKARVNTYC